MTCFDPHIYIYIYKEKTALHVRLSRIVFFPSYQSYKELPGMLDQAVTLKSHDLLDFGDSAPSEKKSTMIESEMTKSAQQ